MSCAGIVNTHVSSHVSYHGDPTSLESPVMTEDYGLIVKKDYYIKSSPPTFIRKRRQEVLSCLQHPYLHLFLYSISVNPVRIYQNPTSIPWVSEYFVLLIRDPYLTPTGRALQSAGEQFAALTLVGGNWGFC